VCGFLFESKKMRFSIITCTLNGEKYLENCLKSIASQTFKNYEVIIIDGYSKDETDEILSRYKAKLDLKIYKERAKGISAAMNEGIRRAKGDYVIHLHSDDSFFDGNVLTDTDKFLNRMDNPDWIYGKINVVEGDGQEVGIFPERKIFQASFPWLLKFFNYIPHQSAFINKNIFDRYGLFDETLKINMDYDLWLRLARITSFKFYDRVISNFRIHAQATSSSISNKKLNKQMLEKMRGKHLTIIESVIAKIVDEIVDLTNKMYR